MRVQDKSIIVTGSKGALIITSRSGGPVDGARCV